MSEGKKPNLKQMCYIFKLCFTFFRQPRMKSVLPMKHDPYCRSVVVPRIKSRKSYHGQYSAGRSTTFLQNVAAHNFWHARESILMIGQE